MTDSCDQRYHELPPGEPFDPSAERTDPARIPLSPAPLLQQRSGTESNRERNGEQHPKRRHRHHDCLM